MPTPETLHIGKTQCDFLDKEEFRELCTKWLESNESHHVVTLNPEMVVLAEDDKEFRQSLFQADLRVPDGSGLIWAHWYIRSNFWTLLPSLIAFSFRDAERITGVDTVLELAQLAEYEEKSMYLLGGTKAQVTKTAAKLKQLYPKLEVHTSRDHTFDINGPSDILEDIKKKEPAILLVAYGAPKQTNWIEEHRRDLPSVRIAIGVGGAFAMLSEQKRRAPRFLRRLNLEWLWRLIIEPKRLPRIWNAVVVFPRLIQQQKNRF